MIEPETTPQKRPKSKICSTVRSDSDAKIVELYRYPLLSSRGDPLFNAFSYPTKISAEAIALFIATHTQPGDIVLDVFAGSGTTGLAAMLCDKPTETMKLAAKKMGIVPVWGPRKATLYELSTIGAFVAEVLTSPPDNSEFISAANALLRDARKKLGWLYSAEGPDGLPGELRHVIWSDVLACPHCSEQTSYWEAAVAKLPLHMRQSFKCRCCKREVAVEGCQRVTERTKDPILGVPVTRRKRVMAEVHGRTGSRKWKRPPNESDIKNWRKIQKLHPLASAPKYKIAWGELFRAGYHTGISHLHHFYTWRNFQVISTLWDLIEHSPPQLRKALRLLVLSYNSSHSTLMTRVVVKKNQKNLVLTGSQSGVLYVSGLPVEKNIIEGLSRKIGVISRAFDAVCGSKSEVSVINQSSMSLELKDRSVHYVFTDPPFGDYIPYAEINQINEAWLRKLTNRTDEVIVSASQHKGVGEYADLMRGVFAEAGRVLKDDGKMTVVFHSSKPAIWSALSEAYQSAGFSIRATSVLDKTQSSFKQVVSEGSVQGDPLLLLGKGKTNGRINGYEINGHAVNTGMEIARELVAKTLTAIGKESTPQRLYGRMVARCLELQVSVPMSAPEFYALVKQAKGRKTKR